MKSNTREQRDNINKIVRQKRNRWILCGKTVCTNAQRAASTDMTIKTNSWVCSTEHDDIVRFGDFFFVIRMEHTSGEKKMQWQKVSFIDLFVFIALYVCMYVLTATETWDKKRVYKIVCVCVNSFIHSLLLLLAFTEKSIRIDRPNGANAILHKRGVTESFKTPHFDGNTASTSINQ